MAYKDKNNNEYDPEYVMWREPFEKTHCKIVRDGTFIEATYADEEQKILKEYIVRNEATLKKCYKHISYTKIDEKGKPKTIICINAWLQDINIRRYDKCEMIPQGLYCPPSIFNLWKASPFYNQDISLSSDKWAQSAVDKFLHQIDILCDNEEEISKYVINWIAHLIQRPYEKCKHLCFTSIQGTGKSILWNVLKKIIGGGTFESTNPARDVWGQFNSSLLDNILIILSEVSHKQQGKSAENKLKGLITDATVPVNQKNLGLIDMKSYHRFVTLTNNTDPLKLEKDDRRNLVAQCSPEKKSDLIYFEEFEAEFQQHNSLLTLYSFLNNLNIDDFKNDGDPPKTRYHKEMLKMSRDPVDEFFEWWVARQILSDNIIKTGENTGWVKIFARDFFKDYGLYIDSMGSSSKYNNAANLVKYVATDLRLPKNSIKSGPRSGKQGPSRFYDIAVLKKHYRISDVVSSPTGESSSKKLFDNDVFMGTPPRAAGAGAADNKNSASKNLFEKDVFIYSPPTSKNTVESDSNNDSLNYNYAEDEAQLHIHIVIDFLEWWVSKQIPLDTINAGCVETLESDIFISYETYLESIDYGGRFKFKDAENLVRCIVTDLDLPENSVKTAPFGKPFGIWYFNIELLKKHYHSSALKDLNDDGEESEESEEESEEENADNNEMDIGNCLRCSYPEQHCNCDNFCEATRPIQDLNSNGEEPNSVFVNAEEEEEEQEVEEKNADSTSLNEGLNSLRQDVKLMFEREEESYNMQYDPLIYMPEETQEKYGSCWCDVPSAQLIGDHLYVQLRREYDELMLDS